VSDDPAKIPSPFDVRTIEKLIALMSQHDMSEVDLREGDLRIRLRRGPDGVAAPPYYPPAAPVPMVTPARTPDPTPEPSQPAKQLVEIKSPTPGTFYAAATPEADPYVHVGARVTSATVVCLIEAMKIFNEIQAECSGIIAETLIQNGQAVEWGQVLFRVDPSA
jgi:acetyl-CoA carboxylase biotin carboxyl carrier protein